MIFSRVMWLAFGVALAAPLSAQVRKDTIPPAPRVKRKPIFIKTFASVKRSSYRIVTAEPMRNFNDADEGPLVVQRIVSALGLASDFGLEATTDSIGAAAGITDDGVRVIVYNSAFIDSLNRGGAGWGATALFAHEIGHHALKHNLQNEADRARMELEADEFAGTAMAKLGATLEQAESVVNAYAPAEDDGTTPGRAKRLAAITRGFANPGRDLRSRTVASSAPLAGPPPALVGPLQTIDRLVAALRTHQPDAVRALFSANAQISLVSHTSEGRVVASYTVDDLANSALAPSYDERTIKRTGEIEGDSAQVLHYYNYYEAGVLHHCGAERYTLQRQAVGWRIVAVEDHQVKESCPTSP